MSGNTARTSMDAVGEKVVVHTGAAVRYSNERPYLKSKSKDVSIPNVSPADFVQEVRLACERGTAVQLAKALKVHERVIYYWKIGQKLPRSKRIEKVYDTIRRFNGAPFVLGDSEPIEEKKSDDSVFPVHLIEPRQQPTPLRPMPGRAIAANPKRTDTSK